MIIVYSELKKLLPNLNAQGRELADTFTLIGHFCAGYKELPRHPEQSINEAEMSQDYWYDLEVRAANRPDCLCYIGIARDIAAYYKLKLVLPVYPNDTKSDFTPTEKIDIIVSSPELVKTLRASKISQLSIQPSPTWLQNLLTLHDINPVNNLVDLTNYVMLLWGIPVHAFDAKKVNNNLEWCTSKKSDSLTTFDGTKLSLTNNLVIKSDGQVVSMSSIGGDNSGIDNNSTETIIEIAVYDPVKVHTDNRQHSIQTEAGQRLEKLLNPQLVPTAFTFLQHLISKICAGKIATHTFSFDNYDNTPKTIPFDPTLPSKYAGTDISVEDSLSILSSLECTLKPDNIVTPPSWRTDITQEEDLVEEVVRIHGYNKISIEEPIDNNSLTDITPKIIYTTELIKNYLVSQGFDEVRSWPIVGEVELLPSISPGTPIKLQNTINQELPYLRQTIISSLVKQADTYHRYKVPFPKFFEIGKIFYLEKDKYVEKFSLGIFSQNKTDLGNLKLLSNFSPNYYSDQYGEYLEIILDEQSSFSDDTIISAQTNAVELTTQLIDLDTTLSYSEKQDAPKLLSSINQTLDPKLFWGCVLKDYFFDQSTASHKYTIRCWYYNTTRDLAQAENQKLLK